MLYTPAAFRAPLASTHELVRGVSAREGATLCEFRVNMMQVYVVITKKVLAGAVRASAAVRASVFVVT